MIAFFSSIFYTVGQRSSLWMGCLMRCLLALDPFGNASGRTWHRTVRATSPRLAHAVARHRGAMEIDRLTEANQLRERVNELRTRRLRSLVDEIQHRQQKAS